jgi:hypothetical protein
VGILNSFIQSLKSNAIKGHKVSLRYCFISGGGLITLFLLTTFFSKNPINNFWKNFFEIVWIAFIYTHALKNFKEESEVVTYKQGCAIGLILVVYSVLILFIFAFVYIKFVDTTLLNTVWEKFISIKEARGKSKEEIALSLNFAKKIFWPFYFFKESLFLIPLAFIVPYFVYRKKEEGSSV